MTTLGATLGTISRGAVEIIIVPGPAISQQHGFVHAGAVSAIADSAAGYAALSLMPAGTGVLTTEFKINLLAPAAGERIIARGRVVKPGRTLTVVQTEVFVESQGKEKLIALLTATHDVDSGTRRHRRLGRLVRHRQVQFADGAVFPVQLFQRAALRRQLQGFCNAVCRLAITINIFLVPVAQATVGFGMLLGGSEDQSLDF